MRQQVVKIVYANNCMGLWLPAKGELFRPRTHGNVFLRFCILFQVMSWLFSIPLRTVNNTKTQENVSVCTGPQT